MACSYALSQKTTRASQAGREPHPGGAALRLGGVAESGRNHVSERREHLLAVFPTEGAVLCADCGSRAQGRSVQEGSGSPGGRQLTNWTGGAAAVAVQYLLPHGVSGRRLGLRRAQPSQGFWGAKLLPEPNHPCSRHPLCN